MSVKRLLTNAPFAPTFGGSENQSKVRRQATYHTLQNDLQLHEQSNVYLPAKSLPKRRLEQYPILQTNNITPLQRRLATALTIRGLQSDLEHGGLASSLSNSKSPGDICPPQSHWRPQLKALANSGRRGPARECCWGADSVKSGSCGSHCLLEEEQTCVEEVSEKLCVGVCRCAEMCKRLKQKSALDLAVQTRSNWWKMSFRDGGPSHRAPFHWPGFAYSLLWHLNQVS